MYTKYNYMYMCESIFQKLRWLIFAYLLLTALIHFLTLRGAILYYVLVSKFCNPK